MALRSHAHQKASSDTASTKVQHTSRPFAPQTKPEAEQTQTLPELQTQLETAQRFGHHLADFSLSPDPSSPPLIQPKLAIGAPGDKYEQEADRVAQQVVQRLNAPQVGGPGPQATVQRQTPEDEELQMKPMLQMRGNARTGGQASPDLESAINQARGGGQSLDDGLQRSMGQAMGADFSGVRVHTDDRADQLNRSIQAKAFTTGQDVFFRQGTYQPGSRGGQELLAHELTHVVQQEGSSVHPSPSNGQLLQRTNGEDENQDETAQKELSMSISGSHSRVVQRADDDEMDIDPPDKTSDKKRKAPSQEQGTSKRPKAPAHQENQKYLQDARKQLGTNLGRKDEPMTQVELSALIGKSNWSKHIEMGKTKSIQPEDKNKLNNLLTKSPAELEELLKVSGANQLSEEQKENQKYLQNIREKLGTNLKRDKPITQAELSALMGKDTSWSNSIERGQAKKIQPDNRKKLEGLLIKSSSELEELLKVSGANQLSEEQKENQRYLQDIRKQFGTNLGRKDEPMTQVELSALIGKSNWSKHIEMGKTKSIQPEDKNKLNNLLTKSPAELEKLLKDSGAHHSEEQKKNQKYLQDIRMKLGKKLKRDGLITEAELSALMGKEASWSSSIERGQAKKIQPDNRKKLEDLLTKPRAELELLLKPFKDQIKDSKDTNSFGKQLRKVRQDLGYINFNQLSNKMNDLIEEENIKVSPHIIQGWELNKRRPSRKRHKILQQILGDKCPSLTDLNKSIELDERQTLTHEEENKKQEVTKKLQEYLKDSKERKGEPTKDEYINNLMGLWDGNSQEFEGFEYADRPSKYENDDFKKMTGQILGKGKERRTVKPFRHMGSQEQKLPMLLTLIAKETKSSVNTFLEACVGSGQFLLQAPYQRFAVADLDPNITNFFETVKDNPRNLEILGRLLKAHLKKRKNDTPKDLKQTWNKQWQDTMERVDPQNVKPTTEAYAASKSLEKALAFILYRNVKSSNTLQGNTENYKEKIESKELGKKDPHRKAYPKDMAVMIHQLDKLPETQIITQDLMKTLKNVPPGTDMIYLDPPYVKFTYDSQQAGTSVGGYAGVLTNDEQIESIQKLGEIIKQKSRGKAGDKPKIIGYCNYATLDLAKECIDNGATKIYLYPLNARGQDHIEMFAVFKRATQANAGEVETPASEKTEQKKNLFNQMEEGAKAGAQPEKEVMRARAWLWSEHNYLAKELVGLYKSKICTPSDLAPIHQWIEDSNQQRHGLMELVPSMRSQQQSDKEIIAAVQSQRDHWHNNLVEIAQKLKPLHAQLMAPGKKPGEKRKPEVYFTPRWKGKPEKTLSSLPPELTKDFSSLNIVGDSSMEVDDPDTASAITQDGRGLFVNQTMGDGNCFFHAIYECVYNMRSTQPDQATIRATVIDRLLNNPQVLQDVLGVTNNERVAQEIDSLGEGEWTQDHTPGLVATVLGLTIVIYNPDGSPYATINPQGAPSHQTIYLTYTGDHFNSHTLQPL
jgi:site-specific DNA-adenine methylase